MNDIKQKRPSSCAKLGGAKLWAAIAALALPVLHLEPIAQSILPRSLAPLAEIFESPTAIATLTIESQWDPKTCGFGPTTTNYTLTSITVAAGAATALVAGSQGYTSTSMAAGDRVVINGTSGTPNYDAAYSTILTTTSTGFTFASSAASSTGGTAQDYTFPISTGGSATYIGVPSSSNLIANFPQFLIEGWGPKLSNDNSSSTANSGNGAGIDLFCGTGIDGAAPATNGKYQYIEFPVPSAAAQNALIDVWQYVNAYATSGSNRAIPVAVLDTNHAMIAEVLLDQPTGDYWFADSSDAAADTQANVTVRNHSLLRFLITGGGKTAALYQHNATSTTYNSSAFYKVASNATAPLTGTSGTIGFVEVGNYNGNNSGGSWQGRLGLVSIALTSGATNDKYTKMPGPSSQTVVDPLVPRNDNLAAAVQTFYLDPSNWTGTATTIADGTTAASYFGGSNSVLDFDVAADFGLLMEPPVAGLIFQGGLNNPNANGGQDNPGAWFSAASGVPISTNGNGVMSQYAWNSVGFIGLNTNGSLGLALNSSAIADFLSGNATPAGPRVIVYAPPNGSEQQLPSNGMGLYTAADESVLMSSGYAGYPTYGSRIGVTLSNFVQISPSAITNAGGTLTSVYYITGTNSGDTIFESYTGAGRGPLTPVTSTSTCQTTPASVTQIGSTLYFHPIQSTNATSDGRLYEHIPQPASPFGGPEGGEAVNVALEGYGGMVIGVAAVGAVGGTPYGGGQYGGGQNIYFFGQTGADHSIFATMNCLGAWSSNHCMELALGGTNGSVPTNTFVYHINDTLELGASGSTLNVNYSGGNGGSGNGIGLSGAMVQINCTAGVGSQMAYGGPMGTSGVLFDFNHGDPYAWSRGFYYFDCNYNNADGLSFATNTPVNYVGGVLRGDAGDQESSASPELFTGATIYNWASPSPYAGTFQNDIFIGDANNNSLSNANYTFDHVTVDTSAATSSSPWLTGEGTNVFVIKNSNFIPVAGSNQYLVQCDPVQTGDHLTLSDNQVQGVSNENYVSLDGTSYTTASAVAAGKDSGSVTVTNIGASGPSYIPTIQSSITNNVGLMPDATFNLFGARSTIGPYEFVGTAGLVPTGSGGSGGSGGSSLGLESGIQ